MLEYFQMFALTVAVELIIVWLATPRPDRRTTAAACVFLNLVTHPAATWLMMRGLAPLLVLELAVGLCEFAGYRAVLSGQTGLALRLAVLANLPTALSSLFWF